MEIGEPRMPDTLAANIIRFGIFEANLDTGELRRNGAKVKLQDQPFQLLALLLAKPGEIVPREELRSQLWSEDTFVDFDHGLNAAVRRLRDALGDSADNPRFVETLSRRGYRFVAPVQTQTNDGKERDPQGNNSAWSARPYWRVALVVIVLLAGSGAGWLAARHFSPDIKDSRFTELRLTANPSDDPVLNAVISPDGKYLAFTDRKGFYLKAVESGETHSVALPDGFIARPVSWFPEGSHVLANKFPGSGEQSTVWLGSKPGGPEEQPSMWSISVFGGNPRKLLENAEARSISPDGSQIAFVRGEKNQEIWLASSDGEQARKIISEPGEMFGSVVWSPDSRRLAFVRYGYHPGAHEGYVSISACNPATKETHIILSDANLGDALAWASDGRLIYSLAEQPPNQNGSDLWAVRLDSATSRPIGEATRLTSSPDRKMGLSVTANGKSLVFLKWSGAPQVYLSDILTRTGRLSSSRRLGLPEGTNLPYAWTSDSKSVLFTSDRDGPTHVFKQAVDQPAPDLLVGGKDSVMLTRLNSDGSEILYLVSAKRNDKLGSIKIMRMPLSGGAPKLVLQDEAIGNFQCAHFPASLCIFSQSFPSADRFVIFDPVTGAKKELTRIEGPPGYKYNWSLSPDGSTIAAAVWRSNQIQFLSTTNGSTKSIVVKGPGGILALDWAPDGRSLWASSSTASGAETLVNIGLAGEMRPMLEDTDKDVGWAIPSPDGHHLALWEASGSANAWSLQGL
jgi:Tol biopolymer transport system component/DNA-binding winged helix-turn-helix (wHTH) protein